MALDVKYFHFHSTGSVTIFNGNFKREVAGILIDVQERRSTQQIIPDQKTQERQLCAALATNLNVTVYVRGLWPN